VLYQTPVFAVDASVVRGASSCGEWVAQRKKSDHLALSNAAWLVGFLSGLSLASGKDLLAGRDNAALYSWMDNYCKEHPLQDTASGARVLLEEASRKGAGK
jgi:hypothetical protein